MSGIGIKVEFVDGYGNVMPPSPVDERGNRLRVKRMDAEMELERALGAVRFAVVDKKVALTDIDPLMLNVRNCISEFRVADILYNNYQNEE